MAAEAALLFSLKQRTASQLAGLLPGARALHGDIQQAQREVNGEQQRRQRKKKEKEENKKKAVRLGEESRKQNRKWKKRARKQKCHYGSHPVTIA
ncbi:hypothetical protein F0562_022344 [Nyssa sinensis]|uniref:Uncharacterized protein n=1 Tax=Nyssa sinensis TaxID=561372 RepID=A0A5J5BRD4_9ASTE|nr:hypothetical protein F0562_022344 [Nyssa sinensis]